MPLHLEDCLDIRTPIKTLTGVSASAGAACTVTIPADRESFHCLKKIIFSYDDLSAGIGQITIQINAASIIHAIPTAGPGPLDVDGIHTNNRNESVVVTLAGVTGATGRLSVIYT